LHQGKRTEKKWCFQNTPLAQVFRPGESFVSIKSTGLCPERS
jgi:hypothetical protein